MCLCIAGVTLKFMQGGKVSIEKELKSFCNRGVVFFPQCFIVCLRFQELTSILAFIGIEIPGDFSSLPPLPCADSVQPE